MSASPSVQPSRRPRILILGAGAVGQVYGYHLHRGGADVTFRVRPAYEESLKQGVFMQQLRTLGGPLPREHWGDFRVISDDAQVKEGQWDQVWLCISSAGLAGPWLDPFLEAVGPDATIVALPPGPGDRQLVGQKVGPERVVHGMISFVAYQAPLPGEAGEAAMAYWLPPCAPLAFGGPEASRVAAVAKGLERAGVNTKILRPGRDHTEFGAALFNPFLMALEVEDWSLGRLKKSENLRLVSQGMKEAASIMSYRTALKPPGAIKFQGPLGLCALLGVAPSLVPFDLEVYLKAHFTKVGDQTRKTVVTTMEMAQEYGIEAPALGRLREQLHEHDHAGA